MIDFVVNECFVALKEIRDAERSKDYLDMFKHLLAASYHLNTLSHTFPAMYEVLMPEYEKVQRLYRKKADTHTPISSGKEDYKNE
jgi:hypothetical protein